MQLFMSGIGATNTETFTKIQPVKPLTAYVAPLEPAQLALCPACPKPKSGWWWVVAIVGGVATGVGITVAAVGSRK
jgi:hypothetical protein